jgi:hypothetical protein
MNEIKELIKSKIELYENRILQSQKNIDYLNSLKDSD